MLRFAPGAAYGAHRHPQGEEYLVLEGELEDGGRTHGAGTYVYHPPDSRHRPRSPGGCILFVRLAEPIELLEGPLENGTESMPRDSASEGEQ